MANADEAVFLWINGWVGRQPLLDGIVEWVVSDYLVPVGMALSLVGLWFTAGESQRRLRQQVGVLVALSAMAVASGSVMLVNAFYFRPRPFEDLDVSLLFYQPTDSSFPANTAAAVFAISAAVWGVNRQAGLVLFVAAGLYGLSRVYAGVHYPLDIVGGAAIGIVAAAAMARAMHLLEPLPSMVIKVARILCLA